jgi:hypothetical protein
LRYKHLGVGANLCLLSRQKFPVTSAQGIRALIARNRCSAPWNGPKFHRNLADAVADGLPDETEARVDPIDLRPTERQEERTEDLPADVVPGTEEVA